MSRRGRGGGFGIEKADTVHRGSEKLNSSPRFGGGGVKEGSGGDSRGIDTRGGWNPKSHAKYGNVL